MKTTVVNLKYEKFDVYVGRAGHGQSGTFGNPYTVGAKCERCGDYHLSPSTTIPCFEAYFKARIASDPEFKALVAQLRGKKLGCFCKPKTCHGDIIAAYVNGLGE